MTDRPTRLENEVSENLQPTTQFAAPVPEKLLLFEEAIQVSKREVVTGTVRVTLRTETRQEAAEVSLNRSVVDVTHVPVGRVVDVAPAVRTEDDTTIVSVVEERFVVVKQLFLREEIHIRQRFQREDTSIPIELRRQVAVVERFAPMDRVIDVSEPEPEKPDQGTNCGESHGHS